jgi:hypothetical protein
MVCARWRIRVDVDHGFSSGPKRGERPVGQPRDLAHEQAVAVVLQHAILKRVATCRDEGFNRQEQSA